MHKLAAVASRPRASSIWLLLTMLRARRSSIVKRSSCSTPGTSSSISSISWWSPSPKRIPASRSRCQLQFATSQRGSFNPATAAAAAFVERRRATLSRVEASFRLRRLSGVDFGAMQSTKETTAHKKQTSNAMSSRRRGNCCGGVVRRIHCHLAVQRVRENKMAFKEAPGKCRDIAKTRLPFAATRRRARAED